MALVFETYDAPAPRAPRAAQGLRRLRCSIYRRRHRDVDSVPLIGSIRLPNLVVQVCAVALNNVTTRRARVFADPKAVHLAFCAAARCCTLLFGSDRHFPYPAARSANAAAPDAWLVPLEQLAHAEGGVARKLARRIADKLGRPCCILRCRQQPRTRSPSGGLWASASLGGVRHIGPLSSLRAHYVGRARSSVGRGGERISRADEGQPRKAPSAARGAWLRGASQQVQA